MEVERARSGAGAHLGLFGFNERLAALGGSVQVDPSPGCDTTVRLWALLPRAPAAAEPGAASGAAAGNLTED